MVNNESDEEVQERHSVYEDAEDMVESGIPGFEEKSAELEVPDETLLTHRNRRTCGVTKQV